MKLYHVQIYHTQHRSIAKYENCLKGFNVIGSSYLDYISCDKQIFFDFYEANTSLDNQVISLDHYNIVGNFTDSCAIYIGLRQFSYSLTFHILNTNPKQIQGSFLEVKASSSNTIVITNCQFNHNHYKTDQYLLSLSDVNAYFNSCQFINYTRVKLISVLKTEIVVFSYCTFQHNKVRDGFVRINHYSNFTMEHCKFYDNTAFVLVHKSIKFYGCKQ